MGTSHGQRHVPSDLFYCARVSFLPSVSLQGFESCGQAPEAPSFGILSHTLQRQLGALLSSCLHNSGGRPTLQLFKPTLRSAPGEGSANASPSHVPSYWPPLRLPSQLAHSQAQQVTNFCS